MLFLTILIIFLIFSIDSFLHESRFGERLLYGCFLTVYNELLVAWCLISIHFNLLIDFYPVARLPPNLIVCFICVIQHANADRMRIDRDQEKEKELNNSHMLSRHVCVSVSLPFARNFHPVVASN